MTHESVQTINGKLEMHRRLVPLFEQKVRLSEELATLNDQFAEAYKNLLKEKESKETEIVSELNDIDTEINGLVDGKPYQGDKLLNGKLQTNHVSRTKSNRGRKKPGESLQDLIIDYLKTNKGPKSLDQIISYLRDVGHHTQVVDQSPKGYLSTVRNKLNWMKNNGFIKVPDPGIYALK